MNCNQWFSFSICSLRTFETSWKFRLCAKSLFSLQNAYLYLSNVQNWWFKGFWVCQIHKLIYAVKAEALDRREMGGGEEGSMSYPQSSKEKKQKRCMTMLQIEIVMKRLVMMLLWILITITLEMISEEDSKRWKVIKS